MNDAKRSVIDLSVGADSLLWSHMERPDLLWPATSRCELAGPKLCGLLIGDVDDGEATEILGDIGIPTFAEVQFAAGPMSVRARNRHRAEAVLCFLPVME